MTWADEISFKIFDACYKTQMRVVEGISESNLPVLRTNPLSEVSSFLSSSEDLLSKEHFRRVIVYRRDK